MVLRPSESSPSKDIVKKQFRGLWKLGSGISLLVVLYVIVYMVWVVFTCNPSPNNTCINPWIKVIYAVWTVAVPFWFFAEWVFWG